MYSIVSCNVNSQSHFTPSAVNSISDKLCSTSWWGACVCGKLASTAI